MQIGDRLVDRYEVVRPIGAGGMGEVYQARDTRLGRNVAIKVLPAAVECDPDRLARFEREARAIAALNHPNICALYDVAEDNGRAFLIMEFLEGETLQQRLARGPLDVDQLVDYGIALADALDLAHRQGLIHRDLKPANIFVTTRGQVKMLDFGLARIVDNDGDETRMPGGLTDAGTAVGTLGYMSPEQLRGLQVDGRSDLFSLGAVLYEMATGRRAFGGNTNAVVSAAILHEASPRPGAARLDLPARLDETILKTLEKDLDLRCQSAAELRADLKRVKRASEPSAAAPPGSMPSATAGASPGSLTMPVAPVLSDAQEAVSLAKRHPMTLAITALVVVGLVAGGIWLAQRSALPVFHRLTFRSGIVYSAMFTPDDQTIVYSAAWQDAPLELFSTRMDSHESRSLGFPSALLLSMSRLSEMALSIHPRGSVAGLGGMHGTLARVPLAGGAYHAIVDDVSLADWTPDGGDLAVVRAVGGRNRLELPAGHVIYETANNILAMRLSPSGDRAALALHAPGFGTDGSIAIVDRTGKQTDLTHGELGDFADLAWAPSGREIWFDFGIAGGDSLEAVDLAGHRRTLLRLPGRFQLFDVSRDGRALINKTNWRVAVYGVTPGQQTERDFSWLDVSEVDDVTPDGTTLVITEFGEGGDPRRWSIYLRKTDDSPAVRLGDGQAMAISPDGTRVLAMTRTAGPQLVLYPTGPGEAVRIPNHGISDYFMAVWLPDGKHILFTGVAPDGAQRCYFESVDGTEFRALSPAGFSLALAQPAGARAPDGHSFVAIDANHVARILSLDGSAKPRSIPGIQPWETPLRWSADARSLYVARLDVTPVKIERLDLTTGARTLWKVLMPAEPAGVQSLYAVQISPDRGWHFYSCWRVLSDLYAVDGLK